MKNISTKKRPRDWIAGLFQYMDSHVQMLNSSKIFAGIMVMVINIASKYVKFKFSHGFENYLKYTFSRDVLIFCIVWMGSRDIYIALIVTACFGLITTMFLNEESKYCILSESFVDYHREMLPSDDDVAWAKDIIDRTDKAKKKKKNDQVPYPDAVPKGDNLEVLQSHIAA